MYTLDFNNKTALSTPRLRQLCEEAMDGWRLGHVRVTFRYSRKAAYSGTCFYLDGRIFINVHERLTYPYPLATCIARTRSRPDGWERPLYYVMCDSAYELSMFIFMHELYHLLLNKAGRNMRQKEARCDRFATRYVTDRLGCSVVDSCQKPVIRDEWDFQDLEGFVAKAAHEPMVVTGPPKKPRALESKPVPREEEKPTSIFGTGFLFSDFWQLWPSAGEPSTRRRKKA